LIVLLYHAVVVHIGLPMIEEICSLNLAGEKVIHIQCQEVGVEAVPLWQIVVAVRIGFPDAVVRGGAVTYIHDVHPE
jgi:hypothetical protein